jgi:RHS repeat-associated protein
MADMTSLLPEREPATWHDPDHDGDYDDTDEGRYHFLHDANFNVVAITNTSHDPITWNTVERYHYSPYGEVTHLEANYSVKTTQASSVGNEFLFTGRRLDPETGLQYSRWRYLHLQMGRWLTRDPIGYLGGMNLYAYVGGKPLTFTDPDGKVAVIVGVIIGGVVIHQCCKKASDMAFEKFPDSGDSFRHCWTSCHIAKSCGSGISKLCQHSKEGVDYYQGDPFDDRVNDFAANATCMDLCNYKSCEECCRDRVGYQNEGWPVKPPNSAPPYTPPPTRPVLPPWQDDVRPREEYIGPWNDFPIGDREEFFRPKPKPKPGDPGYDLIGRPIFDW